MNGICILLKPNNSRLGIIFHFCIKELLTHLHKSAKDNIVFCFTNARSTYYRAGDSLPILRKLLEDLKSTSEISIPITNNTKYFFDNEAFRFLAAIKSGFPFTDDDKETYTKSWDKAVEESVRLINHICSIKPHNTNDTMTLNKAKEIII